MEHSNDISELSKALAAVQGELRGAAKAATNPFFHSTYATLKDVWEAIREPLSKNGLCVIQTTDPVENGLVLNTMLCHSSGQWVKSKLFMKPTKNDPQSLGSAITYARRYGLSAMVGVYQDDDDGNSASQPRARIDLRSNLQQPASTSPQFDSDLSHNYADDNDGLDEKVCELCKSTLKLTKTGNGWYCPNFKDKTSGDHTYIRL